MEVFAKYFRRLLVGNSPQIFPSINRNVENSGNYPLLVEEINKAARDWASAKKIAEVIDTSEGDIFREFDLGTFLSHFKLDPVGNTIIAAAFTHVSKPDLRSKGMLNVLPAHKYTHIALLTLISVLHSLIDFPASLAYACQSEQYRA